MFFLISMEGRLSKLLSGGFLKTILAPLPLPRLLPLPFKRLLGLLGESDDLGQDLAGIQGHRLPGLGANQEAGLHHQEIFITKILIIVADAHPGSCAFLTKGSGIGR